MIWSRIKTWLFGRKQTPCPFCAGDGKVTLAPDWRVRCVECKGKGVR